MNDPADTHPEEPVCTCSAIVSPFKGGVGRIEFRKTDPFCPVHIEAAHRIHREAEQHGVTILPSGKRRMITPGRSAHLPDNME